jgi:hypothetical protein
VAKPVPKKGSRKLVYVLVAMVVVAGFVWWRRKKAATDALPVYVATPLSNANPYAPYYGSSSSGAGFSPSQPYGTNTPVPVPVPDPSGATASTPATLKLNPIDKPNIRRAG